MDTLKKTIEQFRDLYGSMTASQRGTLIIVPMLVLGALGLLMYSSGGSRGEEFLLAGKVFAPDEMERTQRALREAGLTEFRQVGMQISVPRKDTDRYTAALVTQRSLPADFSQDFDRMTTKINAFTSETHRREISDEARKVRMAKLIKAIPEVEDAWVEWERPSRSIGLRGTVSGTALVNVRLRAGRELDSSMVQSMKYIAASALSGISKDQVTVVDLATGKATGPSKPEDAHRDHVLELQRQRTLDYEMKIRQALGYIPDVGVTVNVDLDSMVSKVQRETTLQTKPFTAESKKESRSLQSNNKKPSTQPGVRPNQPGNVASAAGAEETQQVTEEREQETNLPSSSVVDTITDGLQPKAVQVAVYIPEQYYRDVAVSRGLVEGTSADDKKKFQTQLDAIKTEKEGDVKLQVLKCIPTGAKPDDVVVKSVVVPKVETKPPEIAWTSRVGDFVSQWGSTVVLVVFSLIALRMLSRSIPAAEPAAARRNESGAGAGLGRAETEEFDEDAENRPPPPPTKRDELQTMVRDNPEMAAALLNRWVSANK